jgi:hypothetical protein
MTTTRGRAFFDEHMKYIGAGDVKGMVNNTYAENAILYNAFPCIDEPPPNVIKGRESLINLFEIYLAYQGEIEVDNLYNFLETEDVISFQAVITSSKTGKWAVADTWLMDKDFKQIVRHFGVAHKL